MPVLKDRQHQIPGGFQFSLPAFRWNSGRFESFDKIVAQVHGILNANPNEAMARNLPLDVPAIANWVDQANAERCVQEGWLDYVQLGSGFAAPPPAHGPRDHWPLWARTLAAMQGEGDKGVGDTIERVMGPKTSESFKGWYKRTFNRNCGCDGRKEDWNNRFKY